MNQQKQVKDLTQIWKDRRVLITGGTRGLGREIALHLLQLDAKVTVVARTREDLFALDEVSEELFVIPGDIANINDIHRISGQTVGMMEGIDVLINNASYLGPTPLQSMQDIQCEEFAKVMETNLIGPFRLIKAVLPFMKFHHQGLIVNISSDAAVNPYPTWGPYSVSKAALDHMTAIWRKELQQSKIRMVSIDPGDMDTQMHHKAIPDADPDQLYPPQQVAIDLIQFLSISNLSSPRYSASAWRDEI